METETARCLASCSAVNNDSFCWLLSIIEYVEKVGKKRIFIQNKTDNLAIEMKTGYESWLGQPAAFSRWLMASNVLEKPKGLVGILMGLELVLPG